MRYLVLLVAIMASSGISQAQTSHLFTIGKQATVKPRELKTMWSPKLRNLEAPSPDGNSYRSWLMRLKASMQGKRSTEKVGVSPMGLAENPILLRNFETNDIDGMPNDNDMAISNGGWLISVINSSMVFYDTNRDTVMFKSSLEDFADTLGILSYMYDPKVLYDPIEDKFIYVCLAGATDSTSNIVVAFSMTNNPMDGWHMYSLPGNALNNGTWTDYPMISVSDDEFFITANSLINDTFPSTVSDSWKYLFRESFIWQIDKFDGYGGDSLATRYHTNIRFNNKPIRNLCPVKGGSAPYGPNLYLLSNRNFDTINDTIFVLELTDKLDAPALQLKVGFTRTDIPYGVPPEGDQKGAWKLQTNDARVLGAYLENGAIHYVQNSVNPDTSRAAIYHGIIRNAGSTNDIEGHIIGLDSMDFGYPNISYSGKYPGDNEALISFLHTSENTPAGISAVFYDGNINGYSDRLVVKAGITHVLRLGNPCRWGDYSGSQRKYNEPGKVWISGYWGKLIAPSPTLGTRVNATWIAELGSPDTSVVSSVLPVSLAKNEVKVYPNPAEQTFTTEFELPADEWLHIGLYDMHGRQVKVFISDVVKKGLNRFSFSMGPLAKGTYVLRIDSKDKNVNTKKIVKQ